MPLIKCPDCDREVSDTAVGCPHCGYPLRVTQQRNPLERIMWLRHAVTLAMLLDLFLPWIRVKILGVEVWWSYARWALEIFSSKQDLAGTPEVHMYSFLIIVLAPIVSIIAVCASGEDLFHHFSKGSPVGSKEGTSWFEVLVYTGTAIALLWATSVWQYKAFLGFGCYMLIMLLVALAVLHMATISIVMRHKKTN